MAKTLEAHLAARGFNQVTDRITYDAFQII